MNLTARETLDTIALICGTDKASRGHNYCPHYEQYLGPRRDDPLVLLELGVGGHEDPARGGASLRMWRSYLPYAEIHGLDVKAKDFEIPGVSIWRGDAADPDNVATLAGVVSDHHGRTPFDVIIDDASHVSSQTIASFKLLYPHLKPGGLYVIEDLHSSYHDWYYGRTEAHQNPDVMPKITNPPGAYQRPTAMQFCKRLADEVNFHDEEVEEPYWKLFPRKYWQGYSLASVQFFYDICFITKAP